MQIYDRIRKMKEAKQASIETFDAEMRAYDERIRNYAQKAVFFSKFNDESIKKVLTRLMSTYEGEPYVSMKVTYNFTRYFDIHGGYFQNYTNKPLIIVAKSQARESYDDDTPNSLVSLLMNGCAIILADVYYPGSVIQFYTSAEQDVNHLGDIRVPYVREFIDMVINYRIENNLEHIDEAILENLLADFIKKHEQEIAEHKKNKGASIAQSELTEEDLANLSKSGLEKIEGDAFVGQDRLEGVVLPDGLTSLTEQPFAIGKKLKKENKGQ